MPLLGTESQGQPQFFPWYRTILVFTFFLGNLERIRILLISSIRGAIFLQKLTSDMTLTIQDDCTSTIQAIFESIIPIVGHPQWISPSSHMTRMSPKGISKFSLGLAFKDPPPLDQWV